MGLATAPEWAAAGAYVTIADVLEDARRQTAANLTAKGQCQRERERKRERNNVL